MPMTGGRKRPTRMVISKEKGHGEPSRGKNRARNEEDQGEFSPYCEHNQVCSCILIL